MPLGRFTLYTFLGCLPWTFALTGVGYAVGESWTTVEKYLRPISIVIALVLAVAFVWWLLRRRAKARAEDTARPS
jgi:membrane protein DedA with SNARE-associated domain